LINDKPEGIQSTVRLFADDTITYVTISSDADAANLQQDLDQLAEWVSKWLSLNHLQSMDVILLVWVPDSAGIFQGRSYEEHVRFFFDRFVGDVYVPFKKTDGGVGFRADGIYMPS
jgi:hypothetical protein